MNKLLIISCLGIFLGRLGLADVQAGDQLKIRSFSRMSPFSMTGYCEEDQNNKGFFILKVKVKGESQTAGWNVGDSCFAKDGSITSYGKADCQGGTFNECKASMFNQMLQNTKPMLWGISITK